MRKETHLDVDAQAIFDHQTMCVRLILICSHQRIFSLVHIEAYELVSQLKPLY